MFELFALVLVCAVGFAILAALVSLLGLVFKVVLFPIKIAFGLIGSLVGVVLAVIAVAIFLPLAVVVLPLLAIGACIVLGIGLLVALFAGAAHLVAVI